jgi:hypothetical protein
MSALEFRPATPDLVREYYGGPAPWTMKAHVAVKDGRVVGIGGVHYGGGIPTAFSEAREPLSKKDTARCARFMERFLAGFAMPVWAECTGSRKLLERLGFRATGEEGAAGPLMVRNA